jgi:hypothetical protein
MAPRNTSGNIPSQTSRGGSDGPQSQPNPVDPADGTQGTQDVPHAMRTTEEPKKADKPGVYHKSVASIRQITEQDWLQAGISNQGTVIWDDVNGNFRKLEDFTPEALEVLRRDDSFRVVERTDAEPEDN